MINDIIDVLNNCFDGICNGEVVIGLTQKVYREQSENVEYFPGVVKPDGEIILVDVDDISSLLIYHRVNAMALSYSQRSSSGYGDAKIIEDSIGLSLISIWDTRKLNVQHVDLGLILRSRFPQEIKGIKNIQQALIIPVSVNMNNKQIFESEFSLSKQTLLPNFINLIQINYNIQLKYDQQCMKTCIDC